MTEDPPKGDPFRVPDRPANDSPSQPAPGGPPSPPLDPATAAAVRRAGRRAMLLGMTSLVLAVLAPPIGAVLGIWTIVTGRRRLPPDPATGTPPPRGSSQTFGVVAGAVAAIGGVLLSIAFLVFMDDITEYNECRAGANTRVAQDACQSAFEDAILGRFGL